MLEKFLSNVQKLKHDSQYRVVIESDAVDSITIKRLVNGTVKKFTSFCCNDYLGLSHNKIVKKAAIKAIEQYGVGARASRYVTGNNSLYTKLEKKIAKLKKTDDAIVFSSGYLTAIGVIPALIGSDDLIVADRLIHSCLIDGSKLSGARLLRFRHNDIEHCNKILEENRSKFKRCLLITELVFSMDGDVGRVQELLNLAKKFNAILLSDAAHDIEFNGNFSVKNHLKIGTLSKAAGSLGGYVSGNKTIVSYLRNTAKSVIYSTALPPAVLAASLASLKIIEQGKLQKKVLQNAKYFCDLMNLPNPESAIVVIILGDNKRVLKIASNVAKKGFLISAIRPPTVELGKARLRITFSTMHTKRQIKALVDILRCEL